jgi:hypothetical protein
MRSAKSAEKADDMPALLKRRRLMGSLNIVLQLACIASTPSSSVP